MCFALLLSFLPVATLAQAQFQEPTADELKMTADPKAPGAAAVYLNREEATDDAMHYHSLYERIKVLSEKGKELATIRIPYVRGADSVTDIQGRTIHPDGTVIPLTAKPSDLVDVKTKGFQVDTIVFTLPSVEVGSILEYRLKLRYPDGKVSSPSWNLQQPYYVHKAHYFFHPEDTAGRQITNARGETLGSLMYAMYAESEAKVVRDEHKHTFTLDIADIPPLPKEDWMPPLNTLKWRVEFYYTRETTGGAFWEDAGKRWMKDTEEFLAPTGPIRKAAEEIVAPSDTEAQKARKIYEAVMKLNNTSFTRRKSEAERKKEKLREISKAEDVWKQGGGSDDDIALLYVSLARAAGLKVWPMQVVDRNRAIFDKSFLSSRQLDDYLAILVLDGKEVFLDPGQKMCPFGALHWKHALASGFRLSDQGVVFGTTPAIPYKTSSVQRIGSLTVDAAGAVTGTVRVVMNGPEALHWRQITVENDEDEVKKRFNESMRGALPEGVQADFDHFLALDDYGANLIAAVKVTGTLGTATGKRFFLPGLFFESRAQHPFVAEEKRTIPVDVHYPIISEDDVTYTLPEGYTVESMPQTAQVSWPGFAMFKIVSTATGNSVDVVRTIAWNFSILDPKTYPNLHDFYQKVATADQQQLVLTKAAPAKGK
ncbi:MAG: DUF3857 domain-containing protein [Terracidiphilus sp.]